MDFPMEDLMNEQACYDYLVEVLHPNGISCPQCRQSDHLGIHRRHREPILDYQCGHCGCVFNAFTGTVLSRIHRPPSEIILILRGFLQGTPTAQLARELNCDRKELLKLRHKLQSFVEQQRSKLPPLDDDVTELDEMYQNAGEKGVPHPDPEDPPRQRANKRRGHGTFENDRPPIAGVAGRESGEARMKVIPNADKVNLEQVAEENTKEGSTANTDEWCAYNGLAGMGRDHQTVNHTEHEWARDDDGDGIREVHINTMEGIWTGVRNFLRMFRGVSKHYLSQYVATFQLGYLFKSVSTLVLRIVLGCETGTVATP
jgi:transposase-like protein